MLISSSYSQEGVESPASRDLIKQGQVLLEKGEYDKAKLTLKLYQKYVEKAPLNWLKAQLLLIRCNIETNNFLIANQLLKEAGTKLNPKLNSNVKIMTQLNLLKAEILEVKNDFYKAEKIYRDIYQKTKSSEVQIRLANNHTWVVARLSNTAPVSIRRKYLRNLR